MLNRKLSLFKTRRESIKNLGLKSNFKEVVETELNEPLISQPRFPDLDLLKIKENELKSGLMNDGVMNPVKNETTFIRRIMTPGHKRNFLDGIILKQVHESGPYENLKLFSSLNSNEYVQSYGDTEKIKQNIMHDVKERQSVLIDPPLKPLFDNSFKALENWKIKMQERRKVKTSLAKRLQTDPDSLLMSQSAQNILFSRHQDDILQFLFPFFQNGTGAPINRSIWPEKEVTKQDLQLYRSKWKPSIPLGINMTGYNEEILKEMKSTCKRKESSKITMKNILLQHSQYQSTFKDYCFTRPDISDLIISKDRHLIDTKSRENTTFIHLNSETSVADSENEEKWKGPRLLINEVVLSRDAEEQEDIRNTCHIHINFPASITGIAQVQMIYLANRGSCTIQYLWKKQESKKYLKCSDLRSVFFLKINEGIILPDSNDVILATFRSNNPGFFDELWEFHTEPQLTKNKIYIHLHAIALTPDYFIHEREMIQETMYESTRNQIIREIVDDIIQQTVTFENIEKENEIINSNDDEESNFKYQNPDVLWNFDKVQELKSLSNQVLNEEWDLSLNSLEKVLHESQNSNTECCDSLLEEFQTICHDINLPVVENRSVDNGLFNFPSDIQNICYVKLIAAIEKAEEDMEILGKLLSIDNNIYNTFEDNKDSPSIVIENKENQINKNSSTTKKDKSQMEVEDLDQSRNNENFESILTEENIKFRKILFKDKAMSLVRNVIRKLMDDLDQIILEDKL